MMKFLSKIALSLAVCAAVLSSCKEENNGGGETGFGNCYIVNYGSYDGTKASISQYDTKSNQLTNGVYESANMVAMTSNVQFALEHDSKLYFMGNNADNIFHADAKTLVQTKNGKTKDIVKPRYAVVDGNYMYISCYGGDIWDDKTLSYIAKFNIAGDSVEKKIVLEGGPEGLAIANGKLFAALNYDNKVAVMDLTTESFSYIETPGVNSYFLKDNKDNLYVAMVSTFSAPNTEAGLGYINTKTNTLEEKFSLDGISSSYASIMQFSPDNSKIYVAAASYNANWQMEGGIKVFDVASKKFEDNDFVTGKVGMNGLGVNPTTGDVYCFIAENTTAAGLMSIYSAKGDSITTHSTGIAPAWALFVD